MIRILVALLIIALAAIAWLATPAGAHDHWINHGGYKSPQGVHCCSSGKDCLPVPASEVSATRDGYMLSTGEVVPYSEALQSEDKDYWLCKTMTGARRCFFAPNMGF